MRHAFDVEWRGEAHKNQGARFPFPLPPPRPASPPPSPLLSAQVRFAATHTCPTSTLLPLPPAQVCNHPYQFNIDAEPHFDGVTTGEDIVDSSGKMMVGIGGEVLDFGKAGTRITRLDHGRGG